MANDKAAAIQKAQELAAQGRFDQGISQLRKLLDDSSNDANVYNAIGDLYLKQNSTAEAIQVFLDAARVFARDGFGIKAIAIFKKILKVDPGRAEIYTLQGDLNADRGLMSNAIADYLSGAKLYLKTGDSVRALDLYRKIIKLNPANMSVRLKAGELCLGQGLVEEALREYLAVANDY
ncbi:MAG: tetratricopeptide repeat protein, partial [Nitrospirae bacterium]